MKYNLDFIKKDDFIKHIKDTILKYGDNLKFYDLKQFNKNIIDPVKMIFDKYVYNLQWEEIVKNKISRQRDKSNNNEIGYFHQNIFKYISNCEVPKEGFDVIYKTNNKTIYVELKNKHNTMNSSSSQKTYLKMQNQILKDKNCECFLVEIIAKNSQNINWIVSLDKQKMENERIKRVSIDKFYEIITNDKNSFYKMVVILPELIKEIMSDVNFIKHQKDSVFEELCKIQKEKDISFEMSLYLLSFKSYNGFIK